MSDQKNDPTLNKKISASNDLNTEETLSQEQIYRKLVRLLKTTKIMAACSSKVEMYEQLAKQFAEISGYEDSEELAEKCRHLAKKTKKAIKKKIYEDALDQMNHAAQALDYRLAAIEFRKIKGYQDADELAAKCDEAGKKIEGKSFRIRLSVFSLIVIGFIAIFVLANTSYVKYQCANLLKASGSYVSAAKLYKNLDGYQDSNQKLIECHYLNGIRLKEDKNYSNSVKSFAAAGDYKDSREQAAAVEKLLIKNSKPKDLVKINGNEWVILDLKEDQAFLVLKTALPGMAYHDSFTDVTWETSALRKWLNSDFLTQNFTKAQRSNILLSNIKNADNSEYGTAGGNDTKDYIFLMSEEEARSYKSLLPTFKSNCWLRTPGSTQNSAAYLSVDKNVMDYGYAVDSNLINVRPVMWYSLK